MKYRVVTPEVLYVEVQGAPVSNEDIDELVAGARSTPRGRIRLCTHAGPESSLQEMFIVHDRNAYVRPHKHMDKDECITVLRGEVDLVYFDDAGRINGHVRLGESGSGSPFSCRVCRGVWHMFVIRSEVLVFSEVTTGPFDREKMIFAEWAPADGDGNCWEYVAIIDSQVGKGDGE
jgi:cupin fold WbuC family metalloprotein